MVEGRRMACSRMLNSGMEAIEKSVSRMEVILDLLIVGNGLASPEEGLAAVKGKERMACKSEVSVARALEYAEAK